MSVHTSAPCPYGVDDDGDDGDEDDDDGTGTAHDVRAFYR